MPRVTTGLNPDRAPVDVLEPWNDGRPFAVTRDVHGTERRFHLLALSGAQAGRLADQLAWGLRRKLR